MPIISDLACQKKQSSQARCFHGGARQQELLQVHRDLPSRKVRKERHLAPEELLRRKKSAEVERRKETEHTWSARPGWKAVALAGLVLDVVFRHVHYVLTKLVRWLISDDDRQEWVVAVHRDSGTRRATLAKWSPGMSRFHGSTTRQVVS